MALPWWQTAVFYQVYLRSFADSDGDGVGDLRGVIERLDYLDALGVDVIWLSPVNPSPDKDFGYDVADYRSVQPAFGTLADLDELIERCRAGGMRVVLDLVPNHTSDHHAWFQDARTSRDARHRSYYIWADPRPDGSPPNNWRSTFGRESAWELTPETGQMYLHSFLPEQVDLDWWNEDVRREFDEVMRFWLDRGIAGFRLDVAHAIVKDRELRDAENEDVLVRVDLDETYAVQRRWRTLTDAYEDEPRVLLGETWETDLTKLAKFYGSGTDQLHLAFNFAFTFSPLEAPALRDVVARTYALLPPDAWPVWMLSNHDVERMTTRMCGGDERKIRCALLALLTLRGTAVLYQGDEIGLEQVEIPPERVRDVAGRDGCRTPMPWTRDGGWREPWLPIGDATRNVEDEREDASSTLSFVRNVIALRRARSDLHEGDYEAIDAPPGVWAFRRGEATVVALNLADDAVQFDGRTLEAWSGAVSDSSGAPLI